MKYIKSPLNYTGGKYKLLPQIVPLFPKDINTFVDMFGGGFNVGININCNNIIYNEITKEITDLFENIYIRDFDEIMKSIDDVLNSYNNIKTKEDFLLLREDYNSNKSWDKLFVLASFAYNYAIRFNSKGQFSNTSGVGKCWYSESMKGRIYSLKESLNNKNVYFNSFDFRALNLDNLSKNDFVYIDPPYLITQAHYNSKWNEKEEIALLELLDELNDRNIRFALSNVYSHKGIKNNILIEWSKKYNVYFLNYDYNNSWNNSTIKNIAKTVEVLVTNYKTI